MRILKLAIISLVVLFLLVTCIGLLFPSTVRVSRAININCSPDSLNHFISDIKYWKLWMTDAKNSDIIFLSRKTSGAGTVAMIGEYKVSILAANKQSITTEWKNKNIVMQSTLNLYADSSKKITAVQWYFQQHLRWYPWQRFAALLNEKILGPPMEKSLEQLKHVAENH